MHLFWFGSRLDPVQDFPCNFLFSFRVFVLPADETGYEERDSRRGCEGEGSQESQRLLKVQYWQSDIIEGEDSGEDPENVAGYREEYPSWSKIGRASCRERVWVQGG